MIEIIDPKKQNVHPIAWKMGGGWHYMLDYSWVLDQVIDFTVSNDRILEVGAGTSAFSEYMRSKNYDITTMDRDPYSKADIKASFIPYDFGDEKYNVVIWVSAIEHQPAVELIRACYEKSMNLLHSDGLFIATFPVAIQTGWYEKAVHWNLSPVEAMRVFDEETLRGRYEQIWAMYRENIHGLRDAYVGRFKDWNTASPDYIAAGIVKTKVK